MSRQSFVKDAWIKEAEEASSLVEDLEAKTKNKCPEQLSLKEIARSKLSELGIKLDRLESTLPQTPSYQEGIYSANTKETNKNANSNYPQDQTKLSFSNDDQELLKHLLSENMTRCQVQINPSNSYIPVSLLWKTCWGISLVLGLIACVFILVFLFIRIQSYTKCMMA